MRNGLFVEDVDVKFFKDNGSFNIPSIKIKFSNTSDKRYYANYKNLNNNEPLDYKLIVENANFHKEFTGQFKYLSQGIDFEDINLEFSANNLTVKLFIDGCLMVDITYSI